MNDADRSLFEPSSVTWVEGIPFKSPATEGEARENNPEGVNLRLATARWIRGNPSAANLFLRFSREMAGRQRLFGISLITERVRWEIYFQFGEEYKVNNNHRAYLARWVIAKDPSIERWLRFRKVRY